MSISLYDFFFFKLLYLNGHNIVLDLLVYSFLYNLKYNCGINYIKSNINNQLLELIVVKFMNLV